MGHQITVVIPTYNRPDQLSRVLDHILASDVEGISLVEIIVVDDGSSITPQAMIAAKTVASPFTLRCVRQENAGPARARNNGFRRASGDIVLFMDDDILAPPPLLKQHLEAHRRYPASVIIGPCPCAEPEISVPSSRYIQSLEDPAVWAISDEEFFRTDSVISGNLSIEREMFVADGGLYNDDLNSPTAEEFDIIAKLRTREIPVYLGRDITAMHLQPTDIEATCIREYKHGIGVGELAVKSPELAGQLSEIEYFLAVNGPPSIGDSTAMRVKKRVKSFLARDSVRRTFLRLVKGAERVVPVDAVMFPVFRMVIGVHIFAGVAEGKKKFGS